MRVHTAGRTEASAPTGRCAWLPVERAGLRLRPAGRGRTPPLRNGGRFYGFALVHSDLQVLTAQSFRHGYAVPPPLCKGRLWMAQTRRRTASPRCRARQAPPLRYDETRDCSKIRTFPLISRLRRQLPPEGKPWNFAKTQGQKFMSYAQNVIASNIRHLF